MKLPEEVIGNGLCAIAHIPKPLPNTEGARPIALTCNALSLAFFFFLARAFDFDDPLEAELPSDLVLPIDFGPDFGPSTLAGAAGGLLCKKLHFARWLHDPDW